MKNLTTPLISS